MAHVVALRARERRWLSNEVQADLYLLCADGRVAAHSALLADISPFLAAILSSNAPCSNCREPTLVQLAEFTVADCRALVSLIYTGFSKLVGTKVERVVNLSKTLGLELDGVVGDVGENPTQFRFNIDVKGPDGKPGPIAPPQSSAQPPSPAGMPEERTQLRLKKKSDLFPTPERTKTVKKPVAQSMSHLMPMDFVPTTQSTPKPILSRPASNVSKPSVPVSKPSQIAFKPSQTVSKPSPSVSKSSPTVSRTSPTLPVSQPSPTQPRPAPSRTNSSPRIEVTLKQSVPQPSPSALGMRRPEPGARRPAPEQGRKRGSVSASPVPPKRARAERPETRNKENLTKENLTKQEIEEANVILPSALLECIINVKQEVEDSVEMKEPSPAPTKPPPEMLGRESDEQSSKKKEFMSMSNTRNYVCKICDAGFTFSRSFEKHKCSVTNSNRSAGPSTNRGLESPKKMNRPTPRPVLPKETVSPKVAIVQKPASVEKFATGLKKTAAQKAGTVKKVAMQSKEVSGEMPTTPPKVVIQQKSATALGVTAAKKTTVQVSPVKKEGIVRLPNTGTGSNIIAAIAQSEFVDAIEPETTSDSAGSEVQVISETKPSVETTSGSVNPERRQSAPNLGRRGPVGSPREMQVHPSQKMQKCRYCDRSSRQIEVHCVLHHFKDRILGFSRNKRSCNICSEQFADENELALHIGLFHFVLQEIQARIGGARTKPDKETSTKQVKEKIDPTWTPAEETTPRNQQRSRSLENKPQGGTKDSSFQTEKSFIRTGEGKIEKIDSVNKVQGRIGKLVKKEAWKTSESKDKNLETTAANPTPNKPAEATKSRGTERVTGTSERPAVSAKKGAESGKKGAESEKKVGEFGKKGVEAKKKEAESAKKEATRPIRKPAEITTDGVAGPDPGRADRQRVACGTCVKCTLKNCGNCVVCQDMPEFGGQGKLGNKVCVKKVCRNKN